MKTKFEIGFGALQPPIAKQIKKQGFNFKKDKIDHFEKLRESISYLIFNGIITDSVRKKADEKLFKKILSHVKEQNKNV